MGHDTTFSVLIMSVSKGDISVRIDSNDQREKSQAHLYLDMLGTSFIGIEFRLCVTFVCRSKVVSRALLCRNFSA